MTETLFILPGQLYSDPDENNNGLYAIASQDFTVANVGDCNVAIKTN